MRGAQSSPHRALRRVGSRTEGRDPRGLPSLARGPSHPECRPLASSPGGSTLPCPARAFLAFLSPFLPRHTHGTLGEESFLPAKHLYAISKFIYDKSQGKIRGENGGGGRVAGRCAPLPQPGEDAISVTFNKNRHSGRGKQRRGGSDRDVLQEAACLPAICLEAQVYFEIHLMFV